MENRSDWIDRVGDVGEELGTNHLEIRNSGEVVLNGIAGGRTA